MKIENSQFGSFENCSCCIWELCVLLRAQRTSFPSFREQITKLTGSPRFCISCNDSNETSAVSAFKCGSLAVQLL